MPVFDKHSARIKLVILTKPGINNQTWYSIEKENKKSDNAIIEGMIKRFEKSQFVNTAQVLQFYDNKTRKLIAEFKK